MGSLLVPIGAQSSAMLGTIRAMFLGYSIDHYRPSDGTPNAATVAITKGRVSLSHCGV